MELDNFLRDFILAVLVLEGGHLGRYKCMVLLFQSFELSIRGMLEVLNFAKFVATFYLFDGSFAQLNLIINV